MRLRPKQLRLLIPLAALAVAAVVIATGRGGADSEATAKTVAHTEIVTATFPTGRDTDEVSASGSKPIPACELVTKPEAEAILGAGVAVAEKPLGPTCLYSGSGRQVTLVVEKTPLQALRHGARSATKVTADGRQGYCLRYETTAVAFAVGEGRILHITGPCPAGVRFAAKALPRIPK